MSDDDNELVAADGLLRTALLGLEIFGELVDVSLLSDELAGNFLLESYTTHITYHITITFIITLTLDELPRLLPGALLLDEPRPLPIAPPTDADE